MQNSGAKDSQQLTVVQEKSLIPGESTGGGGDKQTNKQTSGSGPGILKIF